MNPIEPMLAKPFKEGAITTWKNWAVEPKLDGHRLIVTVQHKGKGCDVRMFSRPRSDGRQLERESNKINPAILRELTHFPSGVYDGELCAGETATDVADLKRVGEQVLVLFDFLKLEDRSLLSETLASRRAALEHIFEDVPKLKWVHIVEHRTVNSESEMKAVARAIWREGGEGVMVKRLGSVYHAGERKPEWFKVKKVEHAVLTIVGFEKSRGTVRGLGPFAIVKLRDDNGVETTCKTLNDEELNRFNNQWTAKRSVLLDQVTEDLAAMHPAVGKRLMIEFPRRTRDGNYQGPVRWDRWAEGDE